MGHRRAAKIDDNQNEIVAALRKAGCKVVLTHTLKDAFDVLVGHGGRWVAVEIKDGDKLPKKFWAMSRGDQQRYLQGKLTDGERKCFDGAIQVGAPYAIVYDIDSALHAIGIRQQSS